MPRRIQAFIAVIVVTSTLAISTISALGEHSPAYRLTDPSRQWNTFMGGSSNEWGNDITLDGSGNVHVVGSSYTTWGEPVNAHTGSQDAFVARLGSDGARLWNTFLGSASGDDGNAIAVDGSGNVYVVGKSDAAWGEPLNAHAGGGDAFVAKLSSAGALQWLTFLGGPATDDGNGIALDESGNVYVVGISVSAWGAPVSPHPGGVQAPFVAKLNSSGALQWNTFWGTGGMFEAGQDIAIDGSNDVYVVGDCSGDWGAPVNLYAGGMEACLVKLDNAGVRQWNTFLGSADTDLGTDIAIDGIGNVYVVGSSRDSWGLPVNPHGGESNQDPFVAKLNASSGARLWNTFMGSPNDDRGHGIDVDRVGNVFIVGSIKDASKTFSDAFLAQLGSDGVGGWTVFMGRTQDNDDGNGVVTDGKGRIYVTGNSLDSWGAPINAHAGGRDAFAARFDIPAEADLAISKSVSPSITTPGEAVTYTLAFANRGYLTATDVSVSDIVPDALTNLDYAGSSAVLSSTGSLSYTWRIRDLAPGEGGVITITGVVSPGLSLGTVFTNTSTISSATVEGNLGDNGSSASVKLLTHVFLPLLIRTP